MPLRWGPLTLNLGPCHRVTVQLCNANDITTILKVSICNETAVHLQSIAYTQTLTDGLELLLNKRQHDVGIEAGCLRP